MLSESYKKRLLELSGLLKEDEILNDVNLDLTNYDNILEWIKKHGPEQLFDDDGNIDDNYRDPMTNKDLDEVIYEYMNEYEKVSAKNEIEVYRMVMLKNIKSLNLKKVGVFWSFKEDGVGAYGIGRKFSGNKAFTLSAIINTGDINWEQGLYSFLAYGPAEFECYVNKGSEVLIIKIDENILKNPIKGII